MSAARAFLLALLLALPAAAAERGYTVRTLPLVAESGLHDGGAEARVAWTTRVRAPGAAWCASRSRKPASAAAAG
jgi:hypothetical protein